MSFTEIFQSDLVRFRVLYLLATVDVDSGGEVKDYLLTRGRN